VTPLLKVSGKAFYANQICASYMPEKEEPVFTRKLAFAFYAFLLLLGILFYVGWGIFYGTWNPITKQNIGVYAVTIVLVGFGITGVLLYRKD